MIFHSLWLNETLVRRIGFQSIFIHVTIITSKLSIVYLLVMFSPLFFVPFRWEDRLAERVEYDAAGNVKTEIVKSPFVQV